ncbi:metallophosphoesterase N-terminal domain-containing protein [Sphingobacterium multivorum]|uniref:metallophosphoesterase N-terminal domain-containing protein n=1 Tax=Sphingobacterium multivorum TaxID=28454 RepID=UPI001C498814
MTVKGVVYANGVGVANVVVSDGFEVTMTDAAGIYYLPSSKKENMCLSPYRETTKLIQTSMRLNSFNAFRSRLILLRLKILSLRL